MQIAAIYIRVSTDEQTEYSPTAQLKSIATYAEKNNFEIKEEFIFKDEGYSGRTANSRPAFQLMITMAKKNLFDVILVHKFDRFSRNREDSIIYKSLLKKNHNIKVISITEPLDDDKISILIEAMLEAMAEYYSLNLSEEVIKGLKEKAERGERIGKAPLGYDYINAKLIINPEEAEIVKYIFLEAKNNSSTEISKRLNIRNILTKYGNEWTSGKIKYILKNPTYKGYLNYKINSEEIIRKGSHHNIIEESYFDMIQAKLNSKTSFKNIKNPTVKHWLQHIVKCSSCNNMLHISTSHNGSSKQFRCSKCKNKKSISIKKLETLILEKVSQDFFFAPKIYIKRKTENNSYLLEKNLLKLKEEKIKLAYLKNIDSLEEYEINKKAIEKEKSFINNKTITYKKKLSKLKNFTEFLFLDEEDSLKNIYAKQFIMEILLDLNTLEFTIIYVV